MLNQCADHGKGYSLSSQGLSWLAFLVTLSLETPLTAADMLLIFPNLQKWQRALKLNIIRIIWKKLGH